MTKRELNRAFKQKDLETVLWYVLEKHIRETEKEQEHTFGRTMVSNAVSTLSSMNLARIRNSEKIDETPEASVNLKEISKWMAS